MAESITTRSEANREEGGALSHENRDRGAMQRRQPSGPGCRTRLR
jgi:hypothetical protein